MREGRPGPRSGAADAARRAEGAQPPSCGADGLRALSASPPGAAGLGAVGFVRYRPITAGVCARARLRHCSDREWQFPVSETCQANKRGEIKPDRRKPGSTWVSLISSAKGRGQRRPSVGKSALALLWKYRLVGKENKGWS